MATLPPPSEILYQKEHINESRVPTLLGSGITCLGLAVIAVVLRFISRRLGRIKYEYDDWLIIPGLVCAPTHKQQSLDDMLTVSESCVR